MSIIIKAAQFAALAHRGQKRHYTGTNYIEHPMRVAGRVAQIALVPNVAVAAAWLHDVLEDCPYSYDELASRCGDSSARLVQELTNPSKGSKLSRKERKAMDRDHLAHASYWARVIKLHDRIDNVEEMGDAPEDFRRTYAAESRLLAETLKSTDPVILGLLDKLELAIRDMEPKPTAIPRSAVCFFKDGNSWCCVNGDFVNLQESPAGFGETFDEALDDFQRNLRK